MCKPEEPCGGIVVENVVEVAEERVASDVASRRMRHVVEVAEQRWGEDEEVLRGTVTAHGNESSLLMAVVLTLGTFQGPPRGPDSDPLAPSTDCAKLI